jgi:ribosomal protein S12 methylthiotransferase accessory factor
MPYEMKIRFPGGFKVDVVHRDKVIKTDQPVHEGGEDTAPSPFDLFLASMAACAGYYTLAFCKEREIPVDDIDVAMTATRGEESKMIDEIKISLDIPASFPERYRPALVKAVDQCTVKKHILRAPRFEIVLRTKA